MKKSLLALAVLGAFAGSAFAQASSVTIFGKLDQGIAKPLGTKDKQIADGAIGTTGQAVVPNSTNGLGGGSRLAFRGYEDLGGGLGAVFAFETRLNPDTGTQGDMGPASASSNAPARFWNGYSFVGLRSANLGTLTIGRHYTSAFLGVQNQVDPFDGETVASLRNTGMLLGTFANTTIATTVANQSVGAIGRVRVDNSVKYDVTVSGISLSASVGEANPGSTPIAEPDRPYSLSVSYAGGPLWVGLAYENPGDADDKLVNVGARYKLGDFTVRAAYSAGTSSGVTALAAASPALGRSRDATGYLIGGNMTIGSGDVKVGYAVAKLKSETGLVSVDLAKKLSVGYHHALSKRTKLYADFTRDRALTTDKSGYDFGVQHAF